MSPQRFNWGKKTYPEQVCHHLRLNLKKKTTKRKWAEHPHHLCFLAVDATWSLTSHSCYCDFPTIMATPSDCELEPTSPAFSCFCQVSCHSENKSYYHTCVTWYSSSHLPAASSQNPPHLPLIPYPCFLSTRDPSHNPRSLDFLCP